MRQEQPVCGCVGGGGGDLETPRECLTEMLYSSTCVDEGEPAIYPTIKITLTSTTVPPELSERRVLSVMAS